MTDLKAKLAGFRVVASVSGGKDSAALSLWLTEHGIQHDRVFLDTGWEHPATYEYLRGELTRALGPIQEVRGPRTMEEIIRHKRMLPSRGIRWCTELLKTQPMAGYLRGLMDAGGLPVNAVGIRAEESAARAKAPEWEHSDVYDCDVWRPLLAWTFEDVVAIHKRHGLAPNPLYLWGAERVGCWPCVNSRKSEVRMLAERDPARVDLLRELEAVATEGQRERAAAEGREPKEAAAWFRWPIDETVEWSRTSRGGVQFDMLHVVSPERDGCVRWGLCEPASRALQGGRT